MKQPVTQTDLNNFVRQIRKPYPPILAIPLDMRLTVSDEENEDTKHRLICGECGFVYCEACYRKDGKRYNPCRRIA